MMTIIVEVFSAFGLTVSEKTEILLMWPPEKAQQPGEAQTPPLPALDRGGAQGRGGAVVHRGSVGSGKISGVVAQERSRG